MLQKTIKSCLVMQFFAMSIWCATITDVKVDALRGYRKIVGGTSADTNFYMGRITYNLRAEGKDSIFIDFSIEKQGMGETPLIWEKSGDVGIVSQANASDTLKTILFRVQINGDASGNYIAKLSGNANMSAMWQLADSVVAKMTLDQKLLQLYATNIASKGFASDDITLSDSRILVGWRCADGPNGIRYPVTGPANDIAIYGSGDPATVFATEAALGSTWDTTLARRVGQAIAQEARAMGIFCNLGPMSDLTITPLWGRAFETMGEDPYLVGKMTSHQVMGIQSEKVIATPKHFTPYLKENSRQTGQRIIISERALRELFCVPFEMEIKDGHAQAIMTCYNKVRVPGFTTDSTALINLNCDRAAVNHHLVNDILRNEWGFHGIIMTDWKGAKTIDETYAFNAPFDMSMPDGDGFLNAVARINAHTDGWTEDTMNKKVRNVIYGKLWAWGGKLLPNDDAIKTYPPTAILSQDNIQLTLDEAREGIVLARNDLLDGLPVLPLNKNTDFTLAVVGPYADKYRPGGGGSSAVTPDSQISPLTGIRRYLGEASKVTIVTDYNTADAALVFVGVVKEQEGSDRASMDLATDQLDLVTSVMAKVKKTIVVYTGGSASVAGSWSNAPAIVIAFYPGRNQGQAIAEVIFGDVNPSGHLSVTFPKTANDLPSYELFSSQLTYPSADTAHGYFLFEKTKKVPLFWFGHGMSYTSFEYTDLIVRGPTTISNGERFDLRVFVKNIGQVKGADVVQLYVKPTSETIPRRVKDLRGFARVFLQPEELAAVTFTLGPRDFSIYDVNTDEKTGQWKVMPGTYDIIAASTSNPAELVDGNKTYAKTSVTIQ